MPFGATPSGRIMPTRDNRRRTAIELYATGATLSEIEVRTGLYRRQLYRLIARCQVPHEDGRPFGWRAVVPYVSVPLQPTLRPSLLPHPSGTCRLPGETELTQRNSRG